MTRDADEKGQKMEARHQRLTSSHHHGAESGSVCSSGLEQAWGHGKREQGEWGGGGLEPQRPLHPASACWSQSLEKYQ